ncbi:integrator complex subunit 9-like isoform X3 [Symsagittifera roscoffensis]|uniref:integrator complex subunit 9-like isoform X3 n=1 Tax=Symsagittifera roscoffensis TaxID=84072 RepID=UPI00307BEF53
MKVTSLSGLINSPCYILELEQLTVMLDCALDFSPLYHFLPLPLVHSEQLANLPSSEVSADIKIVDDYPFIDGDPEFGMAETNLIPFSSIDVILISNCRSLLSLPYITEMLGFQGLVFATDPTINYGRILLEELIDFVSANPKHRSSTKWKNPSISDQLFPNLPSVPASWKSLFTSEMMNSCMQKVQAVSFEEQVSLYGVATAVPHSSGLSIGSSNWIIKPCGSADFKIAYISGSSQFVTHCRPLDLSPMKNCNVAIISDVTNAPACEPDMALKKFCDALIATLKVGGNVLIPCTPTGVVYDLLECLAGFLNNSGFSNIPICFISPVAQASLAHANIYSEWLNSSKQAKVYLPEPPFVHSNMAKMNSLFVYNHIHGRFSETYKSPSIIFTGHPSLRFGPAVHFVEFWGKSENNSIIFIESDFSSVDAMKPFSNCKMKVYNCPIDTRLTYSQLGRILKDLNCDKVVLARHMMKVASQLKNSEVQTGAMTSSICDLSHIQALSRAESCEINDSLAFEMVKIEHKLAQKCKLETLDKNKTATIPLIDEFQLNNHRAIWKSSNLEILTVFWNCLTFLDHYPAKSEIKGSIEKKTSCWGIPCIS